MTLVEAIYSISHAAANASDLSEFVVSSAEVLANFGMAAIDLTLVNTATGKTVQFSRPDPQQETNVREVARDLVVRGVVYGRLEMKFVGASNEHGLFVEVVGSQLARVAELLSERAKHHQISKYLKTKRSELAARKLLARASGLFTGRRVAVPGHPAQVSRPTSSGRRATAA